MQENVLMQIRGEGLADEEGEGLDDEDENITYIVHPNVSVEDFGA